jgi:hypothetical protein
MRRFVAVVAVGIAFLLTWSSAPASALAPMIKHVDDSFAFTSNLCSFPIRVRTQIAGTETQFFDSQGDTLRDELHLFVYAVWRNPSSGKWVIESDHVNNAIYPDDRFANIGLNFRLILPSGRTVLIDAGKLVFDEDGGVLFEAGKHQVSDGDVGALCAALR